MNECLDFSTNPCSYCAARSGIYTGFLNECVVDYYVKHINPVDNAHIAAKIHRLNNTGGIHPCYMGALKRYYPERFAKIAVLLLLI